MLTIYEKHREVLKQLKELPVYEVEMLFDKCFEEAIRKIEAVPHTLRGVVNLGFNYLVVQTKDRYYSGYCEDDFDEEILNSVVKYNYWEYDDDGFRTVNLIKLKEETE